MEALSDLAKLAQQAGPFAAVLMLTLWYFERQERIATQKKWDEERKELLIKAIEAIVSTKEAISGFRDLLRDSR